MSSRWVKGQSGNLNGPKPLPFWEGMDKSGGDDACWPWTRCVRPNGYGVYRGTTAPRWAYQLTYGMRIPKGLVIRHTCDNPRCCNPQHLLLGTQSQNAHDAMKRGRFKPTIGIAARVAVMSRYSTEDIMFAIQQLQAVVKARQEAA